VSLQVLCAKEPYQKQPQRTDAVLLETASNGSARFIRNQSPIRGGSIRASISKLLTALGRGIKQGAH
jgi:predicted outer membrane repeat protein